MRIGGYETRVARDVLEAVNLVRTRPENFFCLVLSTFDKFESLESELDFLARSFFQLPILLLGISKCTPGFAEVGTRTELSLKFCTNDHLLETLGELERDKTSGKQ